MVMVHWKAAVVSHSRRLFSCSAVIRASVCKALVYDKLGQPEAVVKLVDYPIVDIGSKDVSVDMLTCAINPSDINQIQGVYAIRPPLPAVGGGEGVGVVTSVGAEVTTLSKGDWVVSSRPGMGVWRTSIVASADHFMKISQSIPLHMAATLSINPTTAYRMLKDFVKLKPGDSVIQNGANSGVGESVIQLAAAWGVKTINIIRDRPDLRKMEEHLKSLGADVVVTEKTSGSINMASILKEYGEPILGLNTVGGPSALNLMKHLARNATMVTYGGMSKKPVTVGTGSLIFKDLKIVGYWNSKWLQNNTLSEEHYQMMSDLCCLAEEGRLRPKPCEEYPLEDYKTALSKAMEPFVGAKQLLCMKSI